MVLAGAKKLFPNWKNALLALLAAGLLILAFPGFEWWWTAWFALVPLMSAIEREKESRVRSFVIGWIFGTTFFFGTCWWLTFAPITYAGFPWPLAYFLILIATLGAGIFPAIFAAVLSILIRRFSSWAFLAAPFAWVFTEFLRSWLTGNNWNAIGYSQAFGRLYGNLEIASVGGIYLVSFKIVSIAAFITTAVVVVLRRRQNKGGDVSSFFGFSERLSFYALATFATPWIGVILFILDPEVRSKYRRPNHASLAIRFATSLSILLPVFLSLFVFLNTSNVRWSTGIFSQGNVDAYLIAVQPNVPMSGVDLEKSNRLRDRQIHQADTAFEKNLDKYVDENLRIYKNMESDYGMSGNFYREFYREQFSKKPKLVVLPESPMNFMYNDDREFQQFIGDFARRNNVSVLFNSAEPDATNGKYFNSAVMVGPDGREVGQYDKIFLLPFGEAVPPPLDAIVPGFVGNFSYGREYDILPVGDAKAGVMICFESHFGQLSREYVRNGADVLIEMTNDGYLGPTPVLRQHLANAVFRAVETNRPVLRVTNVGITAYVTEKGAVLDAAPTYQEDTRVWTVSKSNGSQTFYVKYGDWFAWLCTLVTLGLIGFCIVQRKADES